MLVIAWHTYLVIGLIAVRYLFPCTIPRRSLFVKSYLIASAFMFLLHYISVYELNLSYSPNALGTFSPDGAFYHAAGIVRSQNLENPSIITYGSWTISWQYIVAINYRIFGIDPLFPKIFNLFCFSVSAIAFACISFLVSNDERVAKRSYWMFNFFLPLLYFNGRLLRETFMTFLIIMIFYFFALIKERIEAKWILLIICFSLILFFTRAEYLIIIGSVITLAYIFGHKIDVSRKIVYGIVCVTIMGILSNMPFIKSSQIADTVTGEGGRQRYVKSSTDEATVVTGGYLGYVKTVASNPLRYAKAVLRGTIGFFLSPLPNKFLQKQNYTTLGYYFFGSVYNVYFYFLLPAITFGFYFKCKLKSFDSLDFVISATILLTLTAISLSMRDPLRYRLPVYPLLLIYASHGISLYRHWQKYVGFVIVIMVAGVLFFTIFFDVKTLVS